MSLYRPLLGQRVHDLLSVVGAFDPPQALHAVGVGAAAPSGTMIRDGSRRAPRASRSD